MKESIIRFEFKKANGDIRVAFGTLIQNISKGKSTPNYKTLAFFDTIKNQVRSFKIDNLIQGINHTIKKTKKSLKKLCRYIKVIYLYTRNKNKRYE